MLKQTGSGDSAVIQQVTWTGGDVPTEEDSLFQFLGETSGTGTYTFQVQQTYSDGEIVNWSDPETGADPAPTIEAKSSLGGGGTSTLTIVALVVGAVGVILGAIAAVRRRWREEATRLSDASPPEPLDRDRRRHGADAACRSIGARVPDQDVPVGEHDPRQAAAGRRADVRRGGRAEVRDHLGHQRAGPPGGDHLACSLARGSGHARSSS